MPLSHLHNPLRATAPLALVLAVLMLVLLPARAPAAVDESVVADARSLLGDSISSLSSRSSASDGLYFSNSTWINGENSCWRCNIGPGVAAAVYARDDSSDRARSLAIATMDRAIATHQRPDGSFPDVSPGTSSVGVNTMFFAGQLGTAYRHLQGSLDAARAQRWRDSLTRAADFLIDNGEVTWYSNGNINLGYTEVLLFAWKATGLNRFRDAYNRSFDFTLNPPQPRWQGFGLRLTRTPSRADGSDGKGYLGEAPRSGDAGYDPDYTQFQADIASRIWVESRDPRARRLLNLLVNQLRDRVDSSWMLDTSGGSRISTPGRKVPFATPGIATLAWTAGRDDLAPLVRPHFGQINRWFRSSLNNSWWYYRLGTQPTVLVESAYETASPATPSPTAASRPRPPAEPSVSSRLTTHVNRLRREAGLKPVRPLPRLAARSERLAAQIAGRPNAGSALRVRTRTPRLIVSISRQQAHPSQLVSQLRKSPRARRVLLHPDLRTLGGSRRSKVWVVRLMG